MLLLIDNYDSFVYNLARYFERLGQETRVVRNDEIDVAAIRQIRPQAVVLSPGPCTPHEAGASLKIVQAFYPDVPMLGVCLGHQVIAEALGGRIVRAPRPVHGQASQISHDATRLFAGLPTPLKVGRYHSLVVEPESLPESLRPTAWTEDGVLMAFEHATLPLFGVQFHPESILTECGFDLLANFLRLAGIDTKIPRSLSAMNELCEPAAAADEWPERPVTF
jgi:anthranilate synthase/aminodeoxychorismate synthase-like glutamine amidotransferase